MDTDKRNCPNWMGPSRLLLKAADFIHLWNCPIKWNVKNMDTIRTKGLEMNILRCNWKYMHAFFSSLTLFLFFLALFSPAIRLYQWNWLTDQPMNSVIIQWFLLDSSISVPKIECNGSVKIRPKRRWTKRMKCARNHRTKLPFGKNWELECNCNLWVCVCVFVTSNNE